MTICSHREGNARLYSNAINFFFFFLGSRKMVKGSNQFVEDLA